MLKDIWWRCWACPRDVEGAAVDFVHRRNPPHITLILAKPRGWLPDQHTAFRRRIAAIYGLGDILLLNRPSQIGWNRWLLRASGAPDDSQAAVEHILGRVVVAAQGLVTDS